ncbi:uncharacterized protein LOC111318977 [Stylophora pistillata]|uniref:uncharacterized protein LOC111318977 n=1 Tax=Stylophora pistillata TaxID=50429 RepID=UPI000C0422F2|nr:uncharacterized protein LOC111318977 [Stylophora pistillata]
MVSGGFRWFQVVSGYSNFQYLHDMETGVATQTEEFDYLFVTAEKPLEENWFAGDDEKVAFYIGISGFDVLMTVFPNVSPHVNRKVTVIIDCFEVFTNRPSNLYARAQTYSSYKSHSTVKILIGITPQGSISFVSQAWGGRTSDKHLADNCGILNKLVPGDLVMADRGFTIHESVLMQRAELVIPAFTKGRDQLDPIDVEKTRGIANVRIHVERVIGLLRRKYTILSKILPIKFLACDKRNEDNVKPMIDRIITVTSALTDVSPGIVPFD